MSQQITVSVEEQARRRKIMYEALVNARLEGLEPAPIFFEYVERFVHGEMTLAEVIADYTKRVTAMAQTQ
jgi:hypothetical protein